jgi:hypothetical protein
MWQPPVAPPKKRGSGLLITIIVVLAVLLCGGGAAGIYFVSKSGKNSPSASGTRTPGSNKTNGPTSGPTGEPSGGPDANGALDAQQGDCLVNKGSNDNPKMEKVSCAPETYQVLKRIDGTSDVDKCKGTPDYKYNYYFKSTDESQSFVLCMKKL